MLAHRGDLWLRPNKLPASFFAENAKHFSELISIEANVCCELEWEREGDDATESHITGCRRGRQAASPTGNLVKPRTIKQKVRRFIRWRAGLLKQKRG